MRLRDIILFAALLVFMPAMAWAHPHVWVDSASEMVFDDKGRITAIKHHWLFDEEFSAYALQGIDKNGDGKFSREELKPLAKENVELLKDFDYFTFLSVGDYQAGFAAPTDYYLELAGDRLLLHFTLPLAVPLKTRGTVHLEVYDPEYYVAFTLPNAEAVRLVNAPAGCTLAVHPGKPPDAAAAAALATVGADVRALPPGMQSLTAGIENSADANCGGAPPPPAHADSAISQMAGANAGAGDLTALPQASSSADGSAPATQSPIAAAPAPPPPRPSLFRLWMARIVELQTAFNRDLTAGLKGLKAGGGFWWLGSVSFLYGIVHAAGPGHGKVVISSYLVANEARIRRGVLIAFIAAMAQAVAAVSIIGLMAVILNMTSMAITATAKTFEAGSFALVALLGIYLTAQKGRAAWSVMRGGDPHAHHHHHHGHDSQRDQHHHNEAHEAHGHDGHRHEHGASKAGHVAACGHSHVPAEAALRKPGFAGAAAAVVSVGIRPCSGALVILVFALSQGIFWAGVRLDLRDGARHGDNGGGARDTRGRRERHRQASRTRRQSAQRSGDAGVRARRGDSHHPDGVRSLRRRDLRRRQHLEATPTGLARIGEPYLPPGRRENHDPLPNGHRRERSIGLPCGVRSAASRHASFRSRRSDAPASCLAPRISSSAASQACQ